MSFAQNLLRIALESLPPQSGKILELNVKTGVLNALEPICLNSAFEVISRGTPAEGAKLVISIEPARVACKGCNFSVEIFNFDSPATMCPKCGGQTLLKGGTAMYLESMEVED